MLGNHRPRPAAGDAVSLLVSPTRMPAPGSVTPLFLDEERWAEREGLLRGGLGRAAVLPSRPRLHSVPTGFLWCRAPAEDTGGWHHLCPRFGDTPSFLVPLLPAPIQGGGALRKLTRNCPRIRGKDGAADAAVCVSGWDVQAGLCRPCPLGQPGLGSVAAVARRGPCGDSGLSVRAEGAGLQGAPRGRRVPVVGPGSVGSLGTWPFPLECPEQVAWGSGAGVQAPGGPEGPGLDSRWLSRRRGRGSSPAAAPPLLLPGPSGPGLSSRQALPPGARGGKGPGSLLRLSLGRGASCPSVLCRQTPPCTSARGSEPRKCPTLGRRWPSVAMGKPQGL